MGSPSISTDENAGSGDRLGLSGVSTMVHSAPFLRATQHIAYVRWHITGSSATSCVTKEHQSRELDLLRGPSDLLQAPGAAISVSGQVDAAGELLNDHAFYAGRMDHPRGVDHHP